MVQYGMGGAMATLAVSACGVGVYGQEQAMGNRYHMPLESAAHERTFMQWPASLDIYDRGSLRQTQAAIARIANAISDFEPVVMLAAADQHGTTRRQLSDVIELWDIATDDLWCRDSGPTFVRGDDGALAVMDFNFNGWGNKQPHSHDARIAALVAQRLGLACIDSHLVGEQGGFEHDGAGLVLAHASSWINPNRNGESGRVIGERLLRAVGGTKMLWAPGVIGADITDYHIDSLARFIGPGKLLIQMPAVEDIDDPWSVSAFETLAILREASDAEGKALDISILPEPTNIRSRSPDFVASYVNYYIGNGAVIAAQFGDDAADQQAQATLNALYPGRAVIMLDVDALGRSGGGIHCATQQQPMVRSGDAMRRG